MELGLVQRSLKEGSSITALQGHLIELALEPPAELSLHYNPIPRLEIARSQALVACSIEHNGDDLAVWDVRNHPGCDFTLASPSPGRTRPPAFRSNRPRTVSAGLVEDDDPHGVELGSDLGGHHVPLFELH